MSDLWLAVDDAIARGDEEGLQKALSDIDLEMLIVPPVRDDVLHRLLALLDRPDFLAMKRSSELIALLEMSEEDLTDRQREDVLNAYKEAYPKLANWFSQFAVSERLSGICHDRRALLEFWRGMMDIPGEQGRSFVPHGLEHVVRSSDDPERLEALDLLRSMMDDPSERVRGEAELSLARLQH